MLEFNHDYCPSLEDCELFGRQLRLYLMSGDRSYLPDGVTFFRRRHHSDPCPLGEPPHGWDNTLQSKSQSRRISATRSKD
jgi:hypothetical protein